MSSNYKKARNPFNACPADSDSVYLTLLFLKSLSNLENVFILWNKNIFGLSEKTKLSFERERNLIFYWLRAPDVSSTYKNKLKINNRCDSKLDDFKQKGKPV